MRFLLAVVSFSILATFTGASQATQSPIQTIDASERNSIRAQANTAVAIWLPELAEVVLEDGSSYSGQVVDINIETQELVLQRGDNKRTVSLSQIDRVEFKLEFTFYEGTLELYIECRDCYRNSPSGAQESWEVALSNFSFKDAHIGEAEVLELSREENAAAPNATYVVDEIQFDLEQGMMTVLVTPY